MVKTKFGCIVAPREISFVEKDLEINDEQILIKFIKHIYVEANYIIIEENFQSIFLYPNVLDMKELEK
ncbi:MAG: hypothetical protein QW272_05940 [Candidatus Methanomethylicaceae archaeon]